MGVSVLLLTECEIFLKFIQPVSRKKRHSSRFLIKFIAIATSASWLAGCATDPHTGQPSFKETFASDDPCANNSRNVGIAIGALAGVILGNQVKHSNGARLVGAAAGATLGGLIGHDMDQRRCNLAKIAKQYDLKLETSTINANGTVIEDSKLNRNKNAAAIQKQSVGMIVEIHDQVNKSGHFETNSDQLTPQAQSYFAAIAESYISRVSANDIPDAKERADYIAQVSRRKILLIGHTDDTGSSRLNADLSERRAKAVADFMEKRGVPRDSLHFQGAGEAYPVADNTSEEGRAQNRRVEIVEVADAASFDRFLAERKPNYDLYRAAQSAPQEAQAPVPLASSDAPLQPPNRSATKRGTGTAARPAMAVKAAGNATTPSTPASAPVQAAGNEIDFGGVPLQRAGAVAGIGAVHNDHNGVFHLISAAYADEPLPIADCTRDRPRFANAVKALASGKTYRTSEYFPGLYGKTWTEQVNGHQVVLNKVTVLANDGMTGNLPDFKVYTNYNPAKNANPTATLNVTPEVNTYMGNQGLLYRMFFNGKAGLSCVDVVFSNDGGSSAKGGRLVYSHAAQLMATDFKPNIYQK